MAGYYSNSSIQQDAMQSLYLMNPDYPGFADMTNPGNMVLLNQPVGTLLTNDGLPNGGQTEHPYIGIQFPTTSSPRHSSADSMENSSAPEQAVSPTLHAACLGNGFNTWRNVGNDESLMQAAASNQHTQALSERLTGYPRANHQSIPEVDAGDIKWTALRNQQLNITDSRMGLQLDESQVPEACRQGLSLSLFPQQLSNIQLSCFQNRPIHPNANALRISESISDENANTLDRKGFSNSLSSSKYLKVAQELLDEVVSIGKGPKPDTKRRQKDDKKIERATDDVAMSASACIQEMRTENPMGLSQSERQHLQMKKGKLVAMLDEVDRKYKQYHHQMQVVVSTFESAAGFGSAKTYTGLAIKTISRHFRSLRDAIAGQIRASSKKLGEEDVTGGGQGETIRLNFVDGQLRQQRALQQLGMLQQHTWRPQRGLPEKAVSILRAWLFEHFLHPYPSDTDKHNLARQTGLTRNQVSNWFINARVRLWKPMVEEMYLEEVKETDPQSSGTDSKATTESAQNKVESEKKEQARGDNREDDKNPKTVTLKSDNSGDNLVQAETEDAKLDTGQTSLKRTNDSSSYLGLANQVHSNFFQSSMGNEQDLGQGHQKKFRSASNESTAISANILAHNVGLGSEEIHNNYILDQSRFSNAISSNKILQMDDTPEFGSCQIDGLSRFGQETFNHKMISGIDRVSLTLGLQHCEDLSLSGN